MITVEPGNGGPIRITASFSDSAGEAGAPKTLFWSLTDYKGDIVNGRENIEIESPSAVNTVILSGGDTLLADGAFRKITFTGTYDSATDGQDVPLGDQCETFNIEDCD